MRTLVVNVRNEDCDVYIGRGSKWGNPFIIGRDGNRREVIAKFLEYLLLKEGQYLLQSLDELRGKRIGCYCAPFLCHGDILARLCDILNN